MATYLQLQEGQPELQDGHQGKAHQDECYELDLSP